ncbi:hypothetical protein [Corynebacterium diphtheriae]|uniref:hypothetical protein n=1 Tax=Corynebacterium diphtheriae TaxID=1717 RepID=UPI000B4B1DCB|nr:hypothetical protein [Corynebacterium diphtheriae]OWN45190.1 hypothetical protein AY482_10335 [Corynebacterium diphtheriae bv. gravis]UJL50333.1 hypothetical protein FE382_11310 [Corynebacterium diphtheriae]CAB0531699.1 hypothetical protein CIP107515_00052 [Corynebacterium diphtheriae]CAB0672965.1 hypothetical protein FRC0081_00056 [Corynebacterium diphtheriae]CAB0673070.1 hypothetical protein FRC0028_00057 [Corynebacterium diphtheriae]
MSSQVQFVEPSCTPEQQREIALHYPELKNGGEDRLRQITKPVDVPNPVVDCSVGARSLDKHRGHRGVIRTLS